MFWEIIIDKPSIDIDDVSNNDMWYIENHALGHDERDTIIGNFTGKSIDTLFVSFDRSQIDKYKPFRLVSTNNKIPSIPLYGILGDPPKLVNEGDLDGNGTSEIGYMPTWNTSQWRV